MIKNFNISFDRYGQTLHFEDEGKKYEIDIYLDDPGSFVDDATIIKKQGEKVEEECSLSYI